MLHLHNFFQTKHSAYLQTFYRNNWTWKVIERLQFWKKFTHHCTKRSLRESSYCSMEKTFKVVWFLLSGTWFLPFHCRYCWSDEHSHSIKTLSQRKQYHSERVSMKTKRWILPRKWTMVLNFLLHIWDTFSVVNVANEIRVMLRVKGLHTPEVAHDIVRIHSLMIYTDLIEYNIVGDTKAPMFRCFPFFQISRLATLQLLYFTWTIKPLVIYNWVHCS